jgi:hypothetical protein
MMEEGTATMVSNNKVKKVDVEFMGGTLLELLRGKRRLILPKDALIMRVGEGKHFNSAEFVIKSEEYDELQTGWEIPIDMPLAEQIVSLCPQHAHSLAKLVIWFRKMIRDGHMPDGEGRSDQLTAEYCEELLEALEGE